MGLFSEIREDNDDNVNDNDKDDKESGKEKMDGCNEGD